MLKKLSGLTKATCVYMVAVLGALPAYAHADSTRLQTYVVDSFSADALTTVVRPLLPVGGSVSSYQNKLIIHTTADSFHHISQVLGQIDRLPKSLTVSLRIAETSQAQQQQTSAQVVVYGDRSRVRAGGGVSASAMSHNQQGGSLYQVKALSGYPARIDSGTLLALSNGIWRQVLVPVTTGLEVVPQMLPNGQVRLQGHQQYNRSLSDLHNNGLNTVGVSAGALVHTQSAQTEVVAPLGQWVSVGSIVQQKQVQGGLASHASSYVQLPLQIKVDAAP